MVELKDKVQVYCSRSLARISGTASQSVAEAVEALTNLGYSASEAEEVVAQLELDGTESTELIIPERPSVFWEGAGRSTEFDGVCPASKIERIISGTLQDVDRTRSSACAPRTLDEYIGREQVKENIRIFTDGSQSGVSL